ncbi:hypothetical protein Tco_0293230, partial [Tanacetum coccineum]
IGDLETLVDKFVPEKMCEFLKEKQAKDTDKLMILQILGREFEIRAREKNHFIEKLKGNHGLLMLLIMSCCTDSV